MAELTEGEGRTLWHGRFASGPADALLAYTVSLPYDQRLWPDDIAGSRAHVRGLLRGDLLTEEEAAAILGALDQVADELSAGTFAFGPADEDIHTAVERRATEIAGPAGGKLHTGRSRNDQVATDLRLYAKRALGEVAEGILALQEVLLARADEAGDAYLPGYTHLQRAQPILLRHHLLAHGWALARDVDRLLDARRRADVSPLGAGALRAPAAARPWAPASTSASRRSRQLAWTPSAIATSVAEALFALALVGVHPPAHRRGGLSGPPTRPGFPGLDSTGSAPGRR
ncbi:MAG: lyase family protein [Acidimicrobiales bacterium]